MPLEMVAVHDRFGESGTPDQLMKKYQLRTAAVVVAVGAVMQRRK